MDTFGYLSFPGLLKDKAHAIINAFEAIWAERGAGWMRRHTTVPAVR